MGRNKAAVALGIISFLFLLVPDAAAQGGQFSSQFVGVATTAVWVGVVTYIIVKIAAAVGGIGVGDEEEIEGLDSTTHGERGYDLQALVAFAKGMLS